MSNNDNSFGPILVSGSIIGGCIAVIMVVFNVVYSPLSAAICKETDIRCAEDSAVRIEINGKLDKILGIAMKNNEALGAYGTQIQVNTKRLDKIEDRLFGK